MILALDCICIMASLMLANYIRNGRIFRSDNEQMNFGMLLVASLTVFLAMNLLRNMNRNMFLRGPLHEMIHIIRNNVLMFGGTAVFLYFLNILDAYSRLAFFYFLVIDCGLMLAVHQLWKKLLPVLYKRFGETRKLLAVADEEYSAALVEDLKNMKDFSYEVTGIILLDRGEDSGEDYEGIPVPAGRDGLVDYCKGASLDEVIIAVGSRRKKEILADMEILAEMGITLHYQIPVPELSGARQKELSQFGRFYTVTYANRVAPVEIGRAHV